MDVQGDPLVQRTVPQSVSLSATDGLSSLDGEICHFAIQSCALAALSSDFGVYKGHRFPLRDLVPEIVLADLPPEFVLREQLFDFSPTKSKLLGSGGAGAVYRATYSGQPVAVKLMNTSVHSRSLTKTGELLTKEEISLEDFEVTQAGEDALQLFRQLRQEVTVLLHLKHPCVVRLVGVHVRPVAIALELAPSGSLQGILEDVMSRHSPAVLGSLVGPALGQVMSHRIALQVGGHGGERDKAERCL